ncbi:MAG: MATE family efflux transporter, partial [Cytophagales bacterium]|nr:MATE family efflux transporter [Cytophagales bacterium]
MKSIYRYYRPELKEMIHLSLPIVVGQVGTILMGTTDTAMIGQVGATELAASGVANSVFFIVAIIGIGGLIVMSPLISQAKGANDPVECGKVFKSGLVVSGIL